MATSKLLIICIQVIVIPGAMFRIAYLIMENIGEEDKTPLTKKVKNVIKALILIELIVSLGAIIQNYY